ncbi:hypothetical protein AWC04_08470 [Mycolicibacterium fallax]|uniref:DUF3987 domain-containing protein n=2 Tax=Mycolicibacterium fallax TaxID=1793 RepID=A0A1X1RFN8_MYCFA|nr:hypothetical protein AWC04_08470 [Mycolicibacterium fallax]
MQTHSYMKPSTPKFQSINEGLPLNKLADDELYSEVMECGVPLISIIELVARGYQKGNPVALLSKALGVGCCDASKVSVGTGVSGRAIPLNLMVCLVGASGLGKGVTLDAPMVTANPLGGYRAHTPASGEALINAFFETVPAADGKGSETVRHDEPVWANWGEIDQLAAKSANANSTLDATMRSLFTGENAGDESITRLKSGFGCKVEAGTYRFVMFVGAQPDHAGVLLEDATGGTLQRLLWFPLPDVDAPDTSPAIRGYKRKVEKALGVPAMSLQLQAPTLVVWGPTNGLTVDDEVLQELEVRRARVLKGKLGNPLDAHADNLCVRLAAIFAGWRAGLGNPAVIDREAWWWAECLLEYSRRARAYCIISADKKKMAEARDKGILDGERWLAREGFLEKASDAAQQAALDRVLEILKTDKWKVGSRTPQFGALPSDIARNMPAKQRKQTQSFIDVHVAAGDITATTDPAGKTRYWVADGATGIDAYTGS